MEGTLPSYRAQLQNRFEQRKSQRPAYSLRAFARDLGYGAPQLSRVINGKQHLSLATARTVADRLFDSDRERELFVTQVELESATNEKARQAAQSKLDRVQDREFGDETVLLQQEDFMVISDWYHLPILYLTTLRDAPTTVAEVAKCLGIGKAEAGQAIERMERLKLIKRRPQAGWTQTRFRLQVPSGKASGAVRKYHRSMIEKALAAIEGQDIERRYLSARTVGIAPKDLPKYRALVDDFLARVSVLAGEKDHNTHLYQVNVQMFDLNSQTRAMPNRPSPSAAAEENDL